MRKVKIKSRRQLDATKAADAAVLSHRAHRARAAVSGELVVHEPTPEEVEQFSVGGCNQCPPPAPYPIPCGPMSVNDCYREIAQRYRCRLTVASGGQLNVDGGDIIRFAVEPENSNYFLPLYVRLTARAVGDPSTMLVWRLTAVSIKNMPQENYHEPNPSADTVVGVESAAYDNRTASDIPGVEVAWGPFSREALANHLELVGWQPYPPDIAMHPRVEIWGYPVDELPKGWKCGVHPGCVDPPTVPPAQPTPPATPPNHAGNFTATPMPQPPPSSVPVG